MTLRRKNWLLRSIGIPIPFVRCRCAVVATPLAAQMLGTPRASGLTLFATGGASLSTGQWGQYRKLQAPSNHSAPRRSPRALAHINWEPRQQSDMHAPALDFKDFRLGTGWFFRAGPLLKQGLAPSHRWEAPGAVMWLGGSEVGLQAQHVEKSVPHTHRRSKTILIIYLLAQHE